MADAAPMPETKGMGILKSVGAMIVRLFETIQKLTVLGLAVATVFALMPVQAVSAHTKTWSGQHANCLIYGEASHGSSVGVNARTSENSPISQCQAVQAKARWKVDGAWYLDVNTDSSGILVANAGTSGGFDVFGSSDHNGKDNTGYWFGNRIWH